MKDDPAIQPLKDSILPSLASLLSQKPKSSLSSLAEDTLGYIRKTVQELLNATPKSTDYLDNLFLPCGAKDSSRFSQIDIYTLNHDCIIESYFKSRDTKIIDGFKDPDQNGLRRMDFNLFDTSGSNQSQQQVRLLKLHGAINWYRYDTEATRSQRMSFMAIPDDTSSSKKDATGNLLAPSEHPEFLIGTRNKYYDYSQDIYVDLHKKFSEYLKDVDRLIICGYGFGDRIINRYIVRWHGQSDTKRITIIHGDPEQVKRKSRGAIRNILNERTGFIKSWVQEMNKDNVAELCQHVTENRQVP